MKIKYLTEQLEKEYWENKQRLHISSIEVLDYNDPNGGPFSIYTVTPHSKFMDELKRKIKSLWKYKKVSRFLYKKLVQRETVSQILEYRRQRNMDTGEFSTYLFDVRNYNSFMVDIPRVEKSILYKKEFDYKWKWDVDSASSSVFYNSRERMYTIPKFTSVTREDILRCFGHFKNNTDTWCLFNVKWYEFKDDTLKGKE